jgi:DNA (cytosine-5)-methyltransferase 1
LNPFGVLQVVHLVRQDLSIAGKRAGLAGARSGLFMEQVRIVKEMREADKRNGRTGDMVRPRYLVWENVVGAFSSNKGKDFAAVLEEIIKIVEPEAPGIEVPEKGWPTWGGYHDEMGGRWSVVWRTHDAQYWGVPQRRRRISVVADFGGDTASEIQFDGESVSGDIAESGASGEGSAEDAERGFNPAVGDCMTAWDCQSKRIFDTNGKSPTLQGGVGGGVNNPAIFAAIPINDKATRWQGGGESRNHDGSGNGLGIGKEGDPSPTLTAGDRHGVMAPAAMAFDTTQITSKENGSQPEFGKPCHTLNANAHVPCGAIPDVAHTLRAKANCAYREDAETYPVQNMVVRRLTPLECTRLQGYPDGWVDIGDWTDEKGKKHKDADSPKYKALGNSIALPFWDWMLRRMARYLPEGATLGSLFDGIAGFPLIWKRIHGKGTARWASEIEPFPIAVTKKWFGEE